MLSKEQEQKAGIALLNKQFDNIKKAHALRNHETAKQWVGKYGLPYRVALDFIKNYNKESGHPYINECYPLPGYKKSEVLIFVYPNDFDTEPRPEDFCQYQGERCLSFDGITNIMNRLKPDKDIQAREHANKYRKWKEPHTPEWEKCFAHLLQGYDFDKFSEFDLFGTNGEYCINDIELLRNIYNRILADYLKNTKEYVNKEPVYTPEELTQYTDYYFIKAWEKDAYGENRETEKALRIKNPNRYATINGIECIIVDTNNNEFVSEYDNIF